MNKNLILKEWKEKLWVPIFALVFLALFATAAIVMAKDKDFLDFLTGGIQIFFLPLVGVLLGASAFSAEFKDNSWAYLFSRPLKKSTIWISKFTALAGILVAIFLVYYAVLPLIPGLKERLIETSLWGLGASVSFSLFLVSFSLAFFTDKPVLTFFLTLFIFAAFLFLMMIVLKAIYPNLASRRLFDLIDISSFQFLLVGIVGILALGAASLYAFCRTDFSQVKSKISGFFKALAVFLAIGAVLSITGITIEKKFHRLAYLQIISRGESTVFYSSRGAFRFDPNRNRLVKLINAKRNIIGWNIDSSGGNIAWTEESLNRRTLSTWSQELWIMGIDGRNKQLLLKTSDKPDSPLKGDVIFNCDISPDGKKLILISRPWKGSGSALWEMNADGSGLRAFPVDSNVSYLSCSGWSSDNRRVLIQIWGDWDKTPKQRARERRHILLSLDSGELAPLSENVFRGNRFAGAPRSNKLGFFGKDAADPNAPPDLLRIFNLDTLATTDLISIPEIQQVCWNSKQDQIAFLAESGRRLGVVSVSEKRILAERILDSIDPNRLPGTMDWTGDGGKIAMSDFRNSQYILRIFDASLQEEKTYALPQVKNPMTNLPGVYGAGDKFLVFDFPASRIWSFDPATEKWKKLF